MIREIHITRLIVFLSLLNQENIRNYFQNLINNNLRIFDILLKFLPFF